MELFLIAGFLCFFAGFCVLFAALVYWAITRSRRQGERLVAVGRSLGLAPDGSRRIAGIREGVRCSVRFVTEGSGDDTSSWTYVEAEIDPPLRLGLNLRRQGWLGAAFSDLLGARDVSLGDPTFDASFRLNAVERDVVGALFDDGFRAACMFAHRSFKRFWMTDDVVHASLSGHTTNAATIQAHLDGVVRIAQDARRARVAMGPTPREQEVLRVWGELASLNGHRFDPETLVLTGATGHHRFTIVPMLGQSGWSTRFRVTFDRPLGVALLVKREHALASVGRLFGFKDIEVGDPRFDQVFTIKGSDPDTIRHIFAEEPLRAAILDVFAAAKGLEIHDDSIDAVAVGLVSDGAALRQSLGRVVEIAEGIRARLVAPPSGAYR